MITDFWKQPVVVAPNNFIYKSLSNFSCNVAVGCEHACRFCYVPSASTIKLGPALAKYGVQDPDAEWGEYVFVRPWDEKKFRASVRAADAIPAADLKKDGNRAVMFCTTTDPYQVLKGQHRAALSDIMRRALEIIRDESTLNVRILTRSPLARRDFFLMSTFKNRLLFGMSIPTLRNDLAKVYEPKAPAPVQRLETLRRAVDNGLHIYAAVAPVYPDCDEYDMTQTIGMINELKPVTIFMEPINIRSENVARIEMHAAKMGIKLKTEVFRSQTEWVDYALNQLCDFQQIATKLGVPDSVLHLWPDKSLEKYATRISNNGPEWLRRQWNKISAWPK